MRYQSNAADCSATAIQNALRVLGVRVGQHKIARHLGDLSDGADESAILYALGELDCAVDVFESSRRNDARAWLRLAYAAPLLLCVDDWGHWITIAGGCGRRLFLFDSAREPWNEAENGAWPLLPRTILKRWRASRRSAVDTDGRYYGIAVLACHTRQSKGRTRRGS